MKIEKTVRNQHFGTNVYFLKESKSELKNVFGKERSQRLIDTIEHASKEFNTSGFITINKVNGLKKGITLFGEKVSSKGIQPLKLSFNRKFNHEHIRESFSAIV